MPRWMLVGTTALGFAFLLPPVPGPAMAKGLTLYVSPGGNDAWSGRSANPNRQRTDGPFATLERARDAVRDAKKNSRLSGGSVVWLRGGDYTRDTTFVLTAEDSGSPSSPVVYRAYGKEKPCLIGGRPVSSFSPVNNPAILARLDEKARGHVQQADLKAQGVTDYGTLRRRGFALPLVPSALELFFQDRPMTLARWPNDGWAAIRDVPAGQNGGKFGYEGDRPARWKDVGDLWVHGYWTFDWADTYEKVAAIDTERREIATVPPHGAYGYTKGKRFIVLNALEELDAPGEYCVDRKTGVLYFWPPAPIGAGKAVVSVLEDPLVRLDGASHVTLRGLTLEKGRGLGVLVRGGEHDLIEGCVIRNQGTAAVSLEGGKVNGVRGCEVDNTGDGGIQMSGGDRQTLTPAGLYAESNHIHDYARWDRTYQPAIRIDGVGNRIAHNRIHDAPHNAILLGGNDHIIEYNDIARVCSETGDAGAIYMGRDLTTRGNVIRYNRLRDMIPSVHGEGFEGVMGVYLDDAWCGTTVYGNLFERVGRGIMVGGGRDNVVENNVFVDCPIAIHFDARGLSWMAGSYAQPDGVLMQRLRDVPYNKPPYSDRYSHLADILSDDPATPKYNRIVRNICIGGRWIEWQDGMSDKVAEVKDNIVGTEPGFVDRPNGDYRLRRNSAARALGIKPLPLDKIGPIHSAP